VSTVTGSKKQEYIYDRREWSKRDIILGITGAVGFVWGLNSIDLAVGVLIGLLFFLPTCSLYIRITESTIMFEQGSIFQSETILHDKIDGIIFRDIAKFSYGNKFLPWGNKIWGAGPKDSQFVIKLNDGKHYVIRSKYSEEILAAIKKARPSIKVT